MPSASVAEICGNTTFVGYQGVIKSPNWNFGNGRYPNGVYCQYTIIAPTGYHVQAFFDPMSTTQAGVDVVDVFDISGNGYTKIGR